jgi:hypothetical protein
MELQRVQKVFAYLCRGTNSPTISSNRAHQDLTVAPPQNLIRTKQHF